MELQYLNGKWTNEPKLVLGTGLEENVVLGMGYVKSA